MKTTVHRRLALLAGLLLVSLLVFATGIQAAPAATAAEGTGAGSDTAATPPTSLDGWVTAANTAPRNQGVVGAVQASGAQPASSDASSTTAWIVAGSAAVLAVLIVGIAAWALMRRRRQPGESPLATYCARHPEAPVCTAA